MSHFIKRNLTGILLISAININVQAQTVFINEIHYDNTSTDVNEGIEIAGPAGTDLTCYELLFYNGDDSLQDPSLFLTGTIPDQGCGYGTVWFAKSGIQNGSADAIGLYDTCSSAVIQFLSYEGQMQALDGPASGMTSTDIGVSEPSTTPIGQSLQLIGSGAIYTDFSWTGPVTSSEGSVNSGQIFCVGDTILSFAITTISVKEDTGIVSIDVSIQNPSATDTFTVEVAYNSGTASPGSDFNFTTQTLYFPPLDSSNQSATITIVDDAIPESAETIILALQNQSGGAILLDSVLTITIQGNDVVIASCSYLFFSEYIEGSSYNKAIEVYNPTPDTVDLSTYTFLKRTNGNGSVISYTFNGLMPPGDVFVIVNSQADSLTLLLLGDTISAITGFNGDDALAIVDPIGDTVDVFGEWGVDPGTDWTVDTGATSEYTLVRKANIKQGQLYWSTGATEWDVYPLDDFSHLGSHTMDPCTVDCSPFIADAGVDDTLCAGDTITLNASASGGTGSYSYAWYTDTTLSDTSIANPFATPLISTNYIVIATDLSTSCSDTDTVTVVVIPAPVADAGSDGPVCANNAAVFLNGSVSGGSTTGQWSTTGTGIFSPDDITLNATYTPNAADTAAGSVVLILTSTNNGVCAADVDTMIITITPSPVVDAGPDQTVCADNTIIYLNGSVSGGAAAGLWTTIGSGIFIPNDSSLNTAYILSPPDSIAGEVTLILTSTNNGNCLAVSDSIIITITPLPVANITALGATNFCFGDNTELQSDSANTYLWLLNGISTGQTTQNIFTSAAGDYQVIVTGTSGCTDTSAIETVVVNPLPVIDISLMTIDSSSCGSNDGVITGITVSSGTPPFTYQWVNSILTVVGGDSANLVNVSSDSYTLTVTDSNGCSAVSGPYTINDAGAPPAPTASSPSPYCSGDPIADLTAAGTGGTLYWFSDITLIDTLDSGSSFTSGATATDTFYVAEIGTCLGLATQVIITVNPIPTANITALDTTTFCIGDSAELQSDLATTYEWLLNSASTGLTSQGIFASIGGDYQVVATNSLGCSDTSIIETVTVLGPIIDISSMVIDSSSCGNYDGSITGITFTGTAPFTYLWDDGASPLGTSLDLTGVMAGLYNLTVTDSSGCINVSGPYFIYDIGTPIIDIISMIIDSSNCGNSDGSITGITVSDGTPPYTYEWVNSSLAVVGGDSVNLVNVPADSYTLTVADAGGCSSASGPHIIYDVEAPQINDSAAVIDSSRCDSATGAITGITVSGGIPPLTYIWLNSISDTVDVSLGIIDVPCDSYTLTVIGADGCVSSQVFIVPCFPDPPAPTAPSPPPYCQGDVIADLTVTGTGGTLTWYSDAALTVSVFTGSPFASGATTDTSIWVTETRNGCEGTATQVDITVTPAPVVDAGSDQAVCTNNADVLLNGSVSGGTTTGQWITMGTGVFSPDDISLSAIYTPGAADIAAGSVLIILTSTNNGVCNVVTDTLVITITPAPVVDAGSDQTVCANNANVSLSGSVSGGTATGQWITMGTGVFSPDDISLSAIYTPSAADIAAGSVVIILTSTNNGVCNAVTDTIVITITSAPTADAGSDQIICAGDDVTLSGSITVATGGTWTTSGTGTFDDPNILNAIYTPGVADITAGVVTLSLTSTGNGNCLPAGGSIIVIISPNPVAAFTSSPQSGVAPLNVDFTDASTVSSGTICSWSWDFGDGSIDTAQNPTHVYTNIGTYTVCLTVTTCTGCTDTTCSTIDVAVDGIKENDLNSSVNIYPNPTNNGIISIEFNNQNSNEIELTFFNILGMEVSRSLISVTGNSDIQKIDLSGQPNGTYFIHVRNDVESVVRKVIFIGK
ncbi:MAG: PKD domain-containing protein [Bacteroidota bacterium]